jgi:hypothetical protein
MVRCFTFDIVSHSFSYLKKTIIIKSCHTYEQKQDHSIFLNTLKDKERKIKTKDGEGWFLMDLQIHKEKKREG